MKGGLNAKALAALDEEKKVGGMSGELTKRTKEEWVNSIKLQ